MVHSGKAVGTDVDGKVPSEASGSDLRPPAVPPGSHAATAGGEAHAPSCKPSSRSVLKSAPTAST